MRPARSHQRVASDPLPGDRFKQDPAVQKAKRCCKDWERDFYIRAEDAGWLTLAKDDNNALRRSGLRIITDSNFLDRQADITAGKLLISVAAMAHKCSPYDESFIVRCLS